MTLATPYPTQLDLRGTGEIARWRPLVQWLLAVPQLFIAYALSVVRAVLILVSLFDAIVMTFRYE
jgi:hypothetical protein